MLRDQEAVFNEIYAKERWGKGKGSGTGSDPKYCDQYLIYIRLILTDKTLGIKSVLDIGCGDGQLYEGFDWSKVDYTGCDISAEALDLHRARAPERNLIKVNGMDETLDLIYELSPDLVLIKDVMQHWTDEEIAYFLNKLKTAPTHWKYVLTSNNWKFHRDPTKNGQPRVLDRYSWAPIPVDFPAFIEFGFEPIFRYPKGGFKQVMIAFNGENND